jgi:hypothetical protein
LPGGPAGGAHFRAFHNKSSKLQKNCSASVLYQELTGTKAAKQGVFVHASQVLPPDETVEATAKRRASKKHLLSMINLAHPTRFERVAFAFGANPVAFYLAVAAFYYRESIPKSSIFSMSHKHRALHFSPRAPPDALNEPQYWFGTALAQSFSKRWDS